MLGCRSILPALMLALSGCNNAAPLNLPPAPHGLPQGLPKAEVAGGSQVPLETAVIVSGSPTGVYALIARGALNCWFGADGPLKPTHVFEAEAQPPASGGAAEIVLYERDETLRDKRGTRALRVQIAGSETSVRVGTSVIENRAAAGAGDVQGCRNVGSRRQRLRGAGGPSAPTSTGCRQRKSRRPGKQETLTRGGRPGCQSRYS